MERIRRIQAAALAASMLLGTGAAEATVLIFDETRTFGAIRPSFGGAPIPDDYGDRVTGPATPVLGGTYFVPMPGGNFSFGQGGEGWTPNVMVDIFGGNASPSDPQAALWRDSYGDLRNIAFGREGAGSLNILLTADAGFDVVLFGFDLAGWPESDYTIAGLEVRAGGNALFARNDVLVLGNIDHSTFSFSTPLVGSEILIRLDVSNLIPEDHDTIGIDNLRFGQMLVPEPSTALLLGVGLTLLAARQRR